MVAVGTNDGRFIILGENERGDRNCGDLVGRDREQMFHLIRPVLYPPSTTLSCALFLIVEPYSSGAWIERGIAACSGL